MRWLIIGPYPPSIDPAASVTRSVVVEHLVAGDEARVVSPEPSAAHETASIGGAGSLCRVLLRGRGYDGVWVHIGRGVGLSAQPGRLRALAERAALAAVLRAAEPVIVHVGDVDLFPGGRAGQFVLRSGATFECGDEDARRTLVERGAPADAVRVRPGAWPTSAHGIAPASDGSGEPTPADVPEPAPLPSGADRASLEQWIRDRAAAAAH